MQHKIWAAKKKGTEELIERLERLLGELKPFEDKISKASVATKVALYREQENYQDEEPEQDEVDLFLFLRSPASFIKYISK